MTTVLVYSGVAAYLAIAFLVAMMALFGLSFKYADGPQPSPLYIPTTAIAIGMTWPVSVPVLKLTNAGSKL